MITVVSMKNEERLKSVIEEWNRWGASAEVEALAEAAGNRHKGVAAVLFYGSCLRGISFDNGIADLYILVDDYHGAFGSRLQALMNRLLPPNVFYLEVPFKGRTLRAKYAVLTLDDFAKGAHRWFHSYIWGRFAQPCGIVYTRDRDSTEMIHHALTLALCTFLARALPQAPETFTLRELWGTGLSLSYGCELRSEKSTTPVGLFDAAPDYYESVTREALKAFFPGVEALPGDGPVRYRARIPSWERRLNGLAWRLRRGQGKVLSLLRLFKALFTFENGLDYVLWKIERHSGIRVETGGSLNRFPLLAVCVKFWKLFRKGAFR